MPVDNDSNDLLHRREAAGNQATDTREIPTMRTEEIVAELREIVLVCDTPQALLEMADALMITLGLIEGVVDDRSGRRQMTIGQTTGSPYRGRHRSSC
jgi:hypothetical protein